MSFAIRRYKTKRGNDAIELTWYLGRWSLVRRVLVWVGIGTLWVVICFRFLG